jgi:hypothetical protein
MATLIRFFSWLVDMLPLKRDTRFRQGIFKPKNPKKCLNKECIYRSGLELKFFIFCDNNPNILEWGSENFIVPYLDTVQKKNRKYYVDNYVKIKEGDNIKRYLVEIKPFKQTQEPKEGKRKKSTILYEKVMYRNNQDKWNAARLFAKKSGMEFIILTEKELNHHK